MRQGGGGRRRRRGERERERGGGVQGEPGWGECKRVQLSWM